MILSESNLFLSPRERLFKQALDDFDYRVAIADDAADIARLFETFFDEAHYQDRGIAYDRGKAAAWIEEAIYRGTVPHIVASRGNEIIGAVSYSLDGTFCVEPVAVLHMIYVLKAHRRSAVGRTLVMFAVDMAKGDGACAFHAPLASEMEEQRSLINLFGRGGSKPIGVIVGRSLLDGR